MMHRRDIFTLLFKGSSFDEPVIAEPDPVIATPDHLKTDDTVIVRKQWTELPAEGKFVYDLCLDYGFVITLDLVPVQNFSGAGFLLGLKPQDKAYGAPVRVGISQDGCLVIGTCKSERKLLSEQLCKSLQLILEITPRENGKAYAKLRILDKAGLTLSSLKSDAFFMTDFSGDLTFPESDKTTQSKDTGLDWSLLGIEGRKIKYN